MQRFRLRYLSTDLEMSPGEFVVGRSSSCNLAVDDALVSRRHAIFRVSAEGVDLEDLGSRNGVLVNGERIEGTRRLAHLDRVVIGAQEMLLLRIGSGSSADRASRQTLAGMTLDLPTIGAEELGEYEPTLHRTQSVLDRIADKALALGRFDEAERVLGHRLDAMLAQAKLGRPPSDTQRLAGTSYALKLAEGLKKDAWVDWVFRLHEASDELLDADAIARLHDLIRRIRYRGGSAFRSYLQHLRGKANSLSPSQRFLLQRLESLERVLGA